MSPYPPPLSSHVWPALCVAGNRASSVLMRKKSTAMAKESLDNFSFHRSVRTVSSEMYDIFPAGHKPGVPGVGTFDLHIDAEVFHGTLVLHDRLKDAALKLLLSQIEQEVLFKDYGSRVDFILTVYHGKEIGFYSDTVTEEHRKLDSATHKDIDDVSAILAKVLGRHQTSRGMLNEHALVDYFRTLGYTADRGGTDLDKKKIDVVARKERQVIFAQAKLGTVTSSHMRQLLQEVAQLEVEGDKLAAVAGARFPNSCDFIRHSLEVEFGIPLLCIHQTQILQAVPEYRRSLGTETK